MKAFARALIGAAVFSAGVAQAAELSGEAGVSYAFGDVENNNGNDFTGDVAEIAASGRLGAQFDSGVFVQGDAHLVMGDEYDPNDESSFTGTAVGLHLGYRNEAFAVGGFYSYLTASNITSSGSDIVFDVYGVEGQAHLSSFSLYGQIGGSEVRSNFLGTWHDVGFARGGASYFFGPDLRVTAQVLRAEGEVEGVDEAPLTHWSIEGRKRLRDSHVSLFVRYEQGDFRNETEVPNDVLEDRVVFVGASLSFGSDTLQAAERRGASLSAPATLLRYMGLSNQYD